MYLGVFAAFHPQAELAETFYNSVFCRLFERKYFHNQNIFIESTLSKQRLPAPVASVYDSYFPASGWSAKLYPQNYCQLRLKFTFC